VVSIDGPLFPIVWCLLLTLFTLVVYLHNGESSGIQDGPMWGWWNRECLIVSWLVAHRSSIIIIRVRASRSIPFVVLLTRDHFLRPIGKVSLSVTMLEV
jgi:hypothetical protein